MRRLLNVLWLLSAFGLSCTTTCPAGQTMCGEQCLDLQSDPLHCGACDRACEAPAGGSAACGGGVCGGSCRAGKTLCGAACVDVQADPDNCGGCGLACDRPPGGTASCAAGTCGLSCVAGKLPCDGACIDPASDPKHCGGCNTACEAPEGGSAACVDSKCGGACPEGLDLCDGACLDTSRDPDNCGGCGHACEAPAGGSVACVHGGCLPACPAGQVLCDGRCVEAASDVLNCGACGNACPVPVGGEATCARGQCGQACPVGRTACDGACVDEQSDVAHCGACGHACEAPGGGNARCDKGICTQLCADGQLVCSGACRDVTQNVQSCGACDHACPAPTGGSATCESGHCGLACSATKTLCGTACVDLQTDSANCGGCTIACDPGMICRTGSCRAPAPTLSAVAPSDGHARLSTPITIGGQFLLRPTSVTLVLGATRIALTNVLSSPNAVRATVPSDLAAGLYDLELVTATGTATLTGAFRVVDAPLRIDVVNVGQGDGSIIRSPLGRVLTIDGGNVGNGTQRMLPRLSGAVPDYMVVTHFDADHLAGAVELLAGPDGLPNTADDLRPRIALLDHGDNHGCRTQLCRNYLDMRASLAAQGRARAIQPGEVLDLGGGVRATCVFVNGTFPDGTRVYTGSENENNVGLVFDFAGFRYYSGGDVTGGSIAGCSAAQIGGFGDVEGPAARFIGRVDAQKVSHHGSCTASAPDFTGLSLPQIALVSVGIDNSYCHSSRRVLYNFDRLGTDLLMTSPGVVSVNNPSGCPLTERPPRVGSVFGDLSLEVPGSGLFTARASDGTQAWSRDYTVLEPTASISSDVARWPDEAQVALVSSRTALELDAPVIAELQSPPLAAQATLVPFESLDDTLLARIEAGQSVPGTVAAAIALDGNRVQATPSALAPKTSYALVLPTRATGLGHPLVVAFRTAAAKDRQGPKVKLTPPGRGPDGVLLNTRELALEFDEPVSGVSAQSVFLEELYASTDAVRGAVVAQGDGRHFTFQLPQGTRTGPGGASCTALCPQLTYNLRVTGLVRDQAGNQVDLTTIPTFGAGTCNDAGAPTLGTAQARAFPSALSVSVSSDEPISGEIVFAPSATFAADCSAQAPTSACVRVPISLGQCSADACTPQANGCTSWAVAKGLQQGVSYTFEVRAKDNVGLAPAQSATGQASPAAQGGQLVLTEVMASPLTGTEEAGEYVELSNAGSSSVDLCNYWLAKTGSTSVSPQRLCSSSQLLAPGASALVVGSGFVASSYALPAGTPVLKVTSTKLLSNGLSNDPFPALSILQGSGTGALVTGYPLNGKCADGVAMERRQPEAPDLPGAFACGSVGGSPGAVVR